MYKLKRVYICDACDAVSLPKLRILPFGDDIKVMPAGWEEVGRMHFCPVCYVAYRQVVMQEENRRASDNAD